MLDPERWLSALAIAASGFVSPRSTLCWIYFASALAIVFVFYMAHRTSKGGLRGFVAFCFPKTIYTHPSTQLDFKFFVINTLLIGIVIAPLMLTSSAVANVTLTAMIATMGVPSAPLSSGPWVDVGLTVMAVVIADFAFFLSHSLQHRIGFLWEFHKVHHAAETLHPLMMYRSHPVDQMLDMTLMGIATGLVLAMFAYFFDSSVEGLTLWGANAIVFAFNFAGVHLRHSHVRLTYGRLLERILISPLLHQTHHSKAPVHWGKNLGGMFAFWDWMAGTLYIPSQNEELVPGLPEREKQAYSSVPELYLTPAIAVWSRFLAWRAVHRD